VKKRTRTVGALALGALALLVGLRLAILHVPWVGPTLANALRAVLGTSAVTWLEETAAEVADRYNRLVRGREHPRSLDQLLPLPATIPSAEAPATSTTGPSAPEPPTRPADVGPMQASVRAADDGRWKPVPDPARPREAPLLFATLLHPDPKRPWAEVFVVALTTSKVRLYAVAGTVEPEATTRAGRDYARRGLIPSQHQESLVAAFNGGFKTEHGHHGMFVDGVTLVPPRSHLCTVVGYRDGTLAIGSWNAVEREVDTAHREGRLRFWRQAAPCMFERGILNPLLRGEEVRNWGATIEGNVVIRRSAIGLSDDHGLMFIGVSNDTTARAMALAMHHVGATEVAQLDVNWSYPKFLLFPAGTDGRRRAQTLFPGFLFREDDYVRRASERDFFYLTRRAD
jgi:hypothetical protein